MRYSVVISGKIVNMSRVVTVTESPHVVSANGVFFATVCDQARLCCNPVYEPAPHVIVDADPSLSRPGRELYRTPASGSPSAAGTSSGGSEANVKRAKSSNAQKSANGLAESKQDELRGPSVSSSAQSFTNDRTQRSM